MCSPHCNDQPSTTIELQGLSIKITRRNKYLGVVFDSKLNWSSHLAHAIKKSNEALHAIRIIKKYFTVDQFRLWLATYFYSAFVYYSKIWLSPNL
jgi:hypothetical protein